MKKNLIKSFQLQLDYNLDLHKHIENINYVVTGLQIDVSIMPNSMGTYFNVDLVYSLIPQDLCSYVVICNNVMTISIF